MANKCRINRSNGKSAPDRADLLKFATDAIIPSLRAIYNNTNYYNNGKISPQKMRTATIEFLQTLGNSYVMSDHKYIVEALEEVLNRPLYKLLKQIIPVGTISNFLKYKGTADQASANIFTDQIMDDDTKDTDTPDYFLHNAYGQAISAKMQLQRKMNNVVLNSFIIDRESGEIVSNIDQALLKIDYYKKKLFEDIQNYFTIHNINSSIKNINLENTSIDDLINIYSKEISEHLQTGLLSGTEIQSLYDNAYNNNVSPLEKNKAQSKLNAYGAWLALQHFDNFIKMTLGDTIIINPSSSSSDRYSYSTKGTNINTTYRKDDNINLQAEINKLTQALINTSPMIKFGSTTPISGSYMQFSDFSYMTAKIKDLIYDSSASTFFIDNIDNLFNQLSENEKNLVRNKSLRQIISNSRLNPQKYIPLIYKILTSEYNGVYVIKQFTSFNEQDQNILWSIYKNMYDDNFNGMGINPAFHSLYSIQKQNPDSKNYYGAVSSVADCIFSVNFAQYYFEDGVLKLRTLRDAAVDKTRNEIANIINTKNSNELLGTFNFSDYDVNEIKKDNRLDGISFKLPLSSGENLWIHVKDMGNDIVFSKSSLPTGQSLEISEIKKLNDEPSIKKFFDEVLGLNLSYDAEFRKTYQELTQENNDNISPYINQILGLSSHVFFNRYIAQTYVNKRPYKLGKIETIENLFQDEKKRPNFNNNFFNMEMVPKSKIPILTNLAQALGTTRGINSSRQVKDSDNAMLSSQTLSRLLGNMVQQFETQINSYNKLRNLEKTLSETESKLNSYKDDNGNLVINIFNKNEITNLENEIKKLKNQIQSLRETSYMIDTDQNPAASHFGIINNPELFKGMLKSEEIKGLYGNKKQIKFTTSEAVISSFLHNFVLGHCNKDVLDKNSELGGGVIGLLPSVNSDKTTVSIAKFNLNAKVGNSQQTYLSLSNPDIQNLIMTEIGGFYKTMYSNIKSDFDKISQMSGIIINPDDNFAALRAYVETYNNTLTNGAQPITMQSFLFDKVKEYNTKNPTNPIRLIDQIHYISDKNGNITFNNTIKDLMNRFSDPVKTQEFFKLKNTEILKSAIDSGFCIDLFGNSNLNNQPEINYLRENYKDWINDSGQMVLAKVNIDGEIYNVTTKTDLLKLEKTLTIKRLLQMGYSSDQAKSYYNLNPQHAKQFCGYDKLSTKMHLLKDNLILHPMFERYNLMDYLFTQQLMYSTVGSHVAHPAKGSFSKLVTDKQLTSNINENGYGEFKSSSELVTKIEFVDNIATTRTKPVAARWNRESGRIEVNLDLIKQKYNDKAWTKPAKLKDESYVEPIPEDEFESYEEWLTFILEHESAHRINLRLPNETIGQYETRINNIALKALEFRRQQALLAEEASRFYAQHKRNVSFTASMDQFQLNQIDGIPLWYNIAVIDDIKEGLFTIDGNTDSAKPYDGATFVNPIIMYLENYSLNEARAGIDKKQFVHFYDELTGSGGIIKTAGFAITNDRMRNSEFYRKMMKNMTNRTWKDSNGNDYIADITKNFKKESINYGTFYFKRGNKYYEATIRKAEGDNAYYRDIVEINQDGNVVENGINKSELFTDVNNNYKLWEMFGGMHSQEFNGGLLQPSETSLEMVVKAVINTGEIKESGYNPDGTLIKDITAEHIDQPLKNADIHYMPTIGAVKQGAANINPNSYYTNTQDLNFFRIRMTNAGIQLDKEHHADSSTLSLMTQVISSACSMGFNPEQADRLYKALYNLTLQGIKEFKDSFKEILNSNDPSKFETAIADCMIKSMLTSTAQDGDMLRAIASELIKKAREGKELTFKDTKTIPYSDPAVFNKLVTNLSVMMTKAGIKAKMNGILSVLCPTQGIVKMYNYVDNEGVNHTLTLSQLEEKYNYLWNDDDTQETFLNKVLDEIQSYQKEIPNDFNLDTSQINVGRKYKIKFEDSIDVNGEIIKGREIVVDLKYPHDTGVLKGSNNEIIGYQSLKNLLKNGHTVYGKVAFIQEYVKDGSELNSINYKFKGTNGKNYQIWDINYIQDLFEIVNDSKNKSSEEKLNLYLNLIAKYDNGLDKFNQAVRDHFLSYNNGGTSNVEHQLKLAKLYAKQIQQNILFSLSKNNPNKIDSVKIGDELVTIDKNSIQTEAYEIVMPKVFLNEFGLDNYANLNEISKNSDYFYNRMIQNFNTVLQDETLYDVELKRINGDHVYIKDLTGVDPNWNQDLEKVTIHKKRDELGKLWRIDPKTNKKMYELFSDSDEVYRVPRTNTEIIATSYALNSEYGLAKSGVQFYLNNFKYQSIHISEAIAAGKSGQYVNNERPRFEDILTLIANSKNKTAQYWASAFVGSNESNFKLNQELNNFDSLSDKLKGYLREQSKKIHTSFLKSLDIIAARIPAQNQQSFMPMKVVAFDNPNINTAYVSVMQFFLQGSDLDIDAVSLLTHSFSKNGEFHDWSPDFDMSNIEMLNLSMNLPFPTGKELEIVSYDSTPEYVNVQNRNTLLTTNEDFIWLLEEEERKNNLTPETIKEEIEEQKKKESLIHYSNLLKFIEKEKGIIYFEKQEDANDEFVEKLINRINNHNTYLVGVSDDVAEGAIKNYVVNSLYSISTDSANLLEAHTGVDVATNPLKKIANESELSEVQKTFTPGNVFNKFQAIEEASVGKDDIAICATGLKAFFAATQFCNSYLNDNLQNENISGQEADSISKIIKFNPVTIGGRKFSTLANIRVDDINKINKQSEIYSILKDKGFDEDASVIMSALLSLSTDNAKELCLAKINAGTGMIGMYLYGAAIGMDFDVMNKIIASPLGFTIAKLLNSNEFTKRQGKTSVDQALSYLFDGPSVKDLNRFNIFVNRDLSTHSIFEKMLKQVLINNNTILTKVKSVIENNENIENEGVIDSISISNIGNILSKLSRSGDYRTAMNLIELTKIEINNYFRTTDLSSSFMNDNKILEFKSLTNQLCDFLSEFAEQAETLRDTKYTTVYGESNIKDDLNKLALGADEFKRLGQFLRLNQEIKTKPDELINFVLKIENCIEERIKLIKRVNKRLGVSTEIDKNLEKFDFKKFAESFIANTSYYKEQIELYEKYCKTCINPLRILTTVPHYKGYLESMILAYEGDYLKSIKFRAIKQLGNKFIKTAKIGNSIDKTAVYKGVQSFVDDYINNAYLSTKTFKLPDSTKDRKIFIVTKGDPKENKTNGEIVNLGTELGNKTFENFFEQIVVPELKNKYPNNLFIQGLEDVLITDSVTGLKYLAKSLGINMMPSSENERILLGKYRNDFNKIVGDTIKIGKQEYSVVQLFQFYNLLKFKGKNGRNSLLSIFEDITTNQNEYMVDYRTFINEFDSTYDFSIGIPEEKLSDTNKLIIPIDEKIIYKYLAPLSNPHIASAEYIKFKDSNTGKIVLLEKIKKEDTSQQYDDYEDYGFMGDEYNEEFVEMQDQLNEGLERPVVNKDEYEPNYGEYKLYEESGVLSRFDDHKYDNLPLQENIDSFKAGDYNTNNLVISNGYLKSFEHNGIQYKISSVKKIIKYVKTQNEPIQRVIDQNLLKNIIEQSFC